MTTSAASADLDRYTRGMVAALDKIDALIAALLARYTTGGKS